MNGIRYADLFGGVGGFRLGIERASQNNGGNTNMDERREENTRSPQSLQHDGSNPLIKTKCVFYNDIDKYSVQTYNKNFNENWEATDIRTIKTSEIPDIDMLCGGFPCQAFSIAGKRRGFQDTRGTLFFEIARIVKAKRPKIIFLENVKGLLNHEKGKTFSIILQTLSELGYDVQWMVLNSKFFGVPQNRERVFIIGSLGGTSRPEILPFRKTDQEFDNQRIIHPTITGVIARQGSSKEYIKSIEVIGNLNSETWKKRNESIRRVYSTEGTSPTIPTGTGGGVMTKIAIMKTEDIEKAIKKGHLEREDVGSKVTIMDLYNKKEHADRSPALTEPHHNTLRVKEITIHNLQSRNPNRPSLTRICDCGSGKLYQHCCGVPGGSGHLSKKDGSTYCLDTSSQGVEQVGMKIRRLTPTECERLQGFPDGWTDVEIDNGKRMSDTQKYKQMGNAVTVNVIKAIAEKLL